MEDLQNLIILCFRVDVQQNISDYKIKNLTSTDEYQGFLDRNSKLLTIYTLAVATSTILVIVRAYFNFNFSCKASINLHDAMASSIINATMSFFDNHYFGNILNRFSKDLGTIDEYLPYIIYECMRVSHIIYFYFN